MDTRLLQKEIVKFKKSKGFNVDVKNLATEFCLLNGEVAEAFEAWFKNDTENFPSELADIAIYLLGIAEIAGVDLGNEIDKKMQINYNRSWK